jgi:hypothetical protein
MKKKVLIVAAVATVIIIFIAGLLIGYHRRNTRSSVIEEDKPKKIESPIIGTWKHQEIPQMSAISSWVITFKDDGTFTADSEKRLTDKGMKPYAEVWGLKGTFLFTNKRLVITDEATGKVTLSSEYKIVKENGNEILRFINEDGTYRQATVVKGVTYYTAFIKQK